MTRTSHQPAAQTSSIDFFRSAIVTLLQSLEATAEVGRVEKTASAPLALRQSASEVVEHLGKTNRLAKGRFVGPDRVIAAMGTFTEAALRLDAAFVAYRRSAAGPFSERLRGATALQSEIDAVRSKLNLEPGEKEGVAELGS